MKLNCKPACIHDDSHAKAILRGRFRIAREEYLKKYNFLYDKFIKKTPNKKNFYKFFCQLENYGLKHTLIEKSVKQMSFKREVSQYLSLGHINAEGKDYKYLDEERLYPVCFSELDSADPLGENSPYGLKVLFYFTEHALIKMVHRHNLHDLKSIVTVIKKDIKPLFSEYILENLPKDDFVIVNGDAYIPCTHSSSGSLIIKTWISRTAWTIYNEAKLSNLSDLLENSGEIRIFSSEEFHSAVYLEPK